MYAIHVRIFSDVRKYKRLLSDMFKTSVLNRSFSDMTAYNLRSTALAAQAMTTAKQQRFIDEYLIDFNATQAAIRAGYSSDTAKQQGSRMLTNVDVRAAIDDAIRERSSRALVSQDAVLLGLLEEARHTGDGSSHSARVSAWAHIGKHLGMFVDRVHATGQRGQDVTRICW